MATFGYQTIGTQGSNWCGDILGTKFIGASGIANSITAYLSVFATDRKFKFAIYKTSDNSLVGQTEEGTGVSGVGWQTLNFTTEVKISSIEYALVVWAQFISSTSDVTLYYDFSPPPQGTSFYGNNYNYYSLNGNYPNPWSPTVSNELYSIYCTYTSIATGVLLSLKLPYA
jgi:hypothetical protein